MASYGEEAEISAIDKSYVGSAASVNGVWRSYENNNNYQYSVAWRRRNLMKKWLAWRKCQRQSKLMKMAAAKCN